MAKSKRKMSTLALVDILRLQACITKLDVNWLLPRKKGTKNRETVVGLEG